MGSRKISMEDYLVNLQLEWITYKLRYSIYSRMIEKNIFEGVLKQKEEKINNIALKKSYTSILFSAERLLKYIETFYPREGENKNIPQFQYTPKNEGTYRFFDKFFFYKKGVVVEYDNQQCEILFNYIKKDEVLIQTKFGAKRASYNEVRRNISDLIITKKNK